MKFTRLMTMTLSDDHRVIDGVMAAKFAGTVKGILENPEQLIN
jgi:pyruvate/2-oxoglutarate dehydrogenase complex dihydrolipoamide acyltransferase (E2) component